jgi:hypothetical protein
MLNLQFKISMGYSIIYATSFRELVLKGVFGSLQEDLGEDPGLWPTLFPP